MSSSRDSVRRIINHWARTVIIELPSGASTLDVHVFRRCQPGDQNPEVRAADSGGWTGAGLGRVLLAEPNDEWSGRGPRILCVSIERRPGDRISINRAVRKPYCDDHWCRVSQHYRRTQGPPLAG